MNVLLLPLGDNLYAMPLSDIVEVVPMPRVTPVPAMPPAVRGLFNLRGKVVPLLDTAELLGLPQVGAPGFAVVIEGRRGPAGVTTTGPPWGASLGEPANTSDSPAAVALYDVAGRAATLLDTEQLLALLLPGSAMAAT